MIKMAEKQTAGRDYLDKLAPKFAELNDDVFIRGSLGKRRQIGG